LRRFTDTSISIMKFRPNGFVNLNV